MDSQARRGPGQKNGANARDIGGYKNRSKVWRNARLSHLHESKWLLFRCLGARAVWARSVLGSLSFADFHPRSRVHSTHHSSLRRLPVCPNYRHMPNILTSPRLGKNGCVFCGPCICHLLSSIYSFGTPATFIWNEPCTEDLGGILVGRQLRNGGFGHQPQS